MLEVKYSTRFKKDLKVCQKRHYDMNLLQQVINVLAVPAALQPQNKDHSLTAAISRIGNATFSRIGC